MKFKPTGCKQRAVKGFTLAEVLAALMFLAIVVPVAVQGLRIASQAGQMGLRKQIAIRLAENILQEWLLSTPDLGIARSGSYPKNSTQYRWNIRTESWGRESLSLVTVQVLFAVQNQEHEIALSTLADLSSQ
ncbi:MAG TPA: type II secretion system protein [Candidatus Paceibacterota bacterium]|nr:type II secretion system protein [Verrucomicrobiota bacterium]HRY46831.1 type II secretion system protein [Candidatus Paceibacterota bacterium]HSA01618.1 type II secretion system protein [Candidatus Paceibacterota bacterium]